MESELVYEESNPQIQLESSESLNIPALFPFSLDLTNEQMEVIQGMLPNGFSLKKTKDQSKKASSNPKKKIHLNDGNSAQINRKLSNNNQNVSVCESKTSNHSIPVSNSNCNQTNRALRQKSSKINYEKKYAEMETSPITSSMKNLKNANEGLKKAYRILFLLKKNLNSEPFLKPVDPIALNIPDYFSIIHEPMDLSTVEKNLLNSSYKNHLEFASDVRKIWNNSFLYNAKGSVVYHMTCEMSNLFERLYKDVEKKVSHDNINELQKKIDQLSKELNTLYSNGNIQKQPSKQSSSLKSNQNYSYKSNLEKNQASNNINMDKPMSLNEKKNLGQNIRKLPPEYLRGVWEIVCDGTNLAQDKEELEFDIETLNVRKVRELERYVKSKLKIVAKANMRKNRKNAEAKKIITEPEFSEQKKIKDKNINNLNFVTTNVGLKPEPKNNEGFYQMPAENNNLNSFPLNEEFHNPIFQAQNASRLGVENKSSDSSFITDSSEESGGESFVEGVI